MNCLSSVLEILDKDEGEWQFHEEIVLSHIMRWLQKSSQQQQTGSSLLSSSAPTTTTKLPKTKGCFESSIKRRCTLKYLDRKEIQRALKWLQKIGVIVLNPSTGLVSYPTNKSVEKRVEASGDDDGEKDETEEEKEKDEEAEKMQEREEEKKEEEEEEEEEEILPCRDSENIKKWLEESKSNPLHLRGLIRSLAFRTQRTVSTSPSSIIERLFSKGILSLQQKKEDSKQREEEERRASIYFPKTTPKAKDPKLVYHFDCVERESENIKSLKDFASQWKEIELSLWGGPSLGFVPSSSSSSGISVVLFSGLPPDVCPSDAQELFSMFGKCCVQFSDDKQQQQSGKKRSRQQQQQQKQTSQSGRILFEKKEDAERAVCQLVGAKVDGNCLSVFHCGEEEEEEKKEKEKERKRERRDSGFGNKGGGFKKGFKKGRDSSSSSFSFGERRKKRVRASSPFN